MYQISFKASVKDDLKKIDRQNLACIIQAIKALEVGVVHELRLEERIIRLPNRFIPFILTSLKVALKSKIEPL
ncbi:MAG: hypothetical protein NZ526_06230 [Aquificaceae bacterium]|nr:hypothetical protein [Aquificaceae bacterium]